MRNTTYFIQNPAYSSWFEGHLQGEYVTGSKRDANLRAKEISLAYNGAMVNVFKYSHSVEIPAVVVQNPNYR